MRPRRSAPTNPRGEPESAPPYVPGAGCAGSGACQQGRHSGSCDCGWLQQNNSDGSDASEAGIHAEATMGEAFRWLAITLALVALAVWLGLVAGYWSAP